MRARIEAFIRARRQRRLLQREHLRLPDPLHRRRQRLHLRQGAPVREGPRHLGGRQLVGGAPRERRDRDEHPPGRRLVGRPPRHRRLHGPARGPLGLRGHRPQGRRRVRRRPRLPAGRLRGGRRDLHPEGRPGRRHRRPGDAARTSSSSGSRSWARAGCAAGPHAAATMGTLHERPRRDRLQRRDHRLAVPGRAQRRGRADHAQRARPAAPPGGAHRSGPCRPATGACWPWPARWRTSTWTRPGCRRTATAGARGAYAWRCRGRAEPAAPRRPATGFTFEARDAARAGAGHGHGDRDGCRPAGGLRDADLRAAVGGGGPQGRGARARCARW